MDEEQTVEEPRVEDMSDEDIEFMRNVSNGLLIDTVNLGREWEEIDQDVRGSLFNVNVPEDGENYNVPVILSRKRLASVGFKYELTFYDSGLMADVYKIDSSRSHSLKELGELVFGE